MEYEAGERYDILVSQAEYRNRPFSTRIVTSHFSGTFAFHTQKEAIDYLFQAAKTHKRQVVSGIYGTSWTNFDVYHSHVQSGNDKMPARWFFLD